MLQQDYSVCGEMRTKISRLLKQVKKNSVWLSVWLKSYKVKKATAAAAVECVKTLKGGLPALPNEKALEEIINKTKASAVAHDLKMPDPSTDIDGRDFPHP